MKYCYLLTVNCLARLTDVTVKRSEFTAVQIDCDPFIPRTLIEKIRMNVVSLATVSHHRLFPNQICLSIPLHIRI